jgi:hypothetical protein
MLVVLAALSIVASAGAAPSTGPTSLVLTYWEDGSQAQDREVWTLRCNPAGGTLAKPGVACRKLAAGGWRLFAPVRDGVCTEIYGGPQVARVVGTVQGKRVWARFTRENGCQISRWNRLSPWLLPPGGATR